MEVPVLKTGKPRAELTLVRGGITRVFIIRKIFIRLVELFRLAVIVTVLTLLLYAVMSVLSHRVLFDEALRGLPRLISLPWFAYLLLNRKVREYDKKSREETNMIRDIEHHFLQACPGRTISARFRYGRRLTWYAWLRTDTGKEYRAAEVREGGRAFLVIYDDAAGKLMSSFSYPASCRETGADKVKRVKEKLEELCSSPIYTIEYADEDGRQCPLFPCVLFETTDKARYLAIEITGDGLPVRFIQDLQKGAVIDIWAAE